MSRKILLAGVALILVLALALAGCTKETPAPAPAPEPTPAPTPTPAPVQPIELKWTSQWKINSDDGKADQILLDMIQTRTNGKVKITYYELESLGKSAEWVNMLKGGVCEMGTLMLPTYPGQFKMELINDLPMLPIPDRATLNDMMWELNSKGYFTGLNEFKPMAFLGGPPLTLFFRDVKVQKIEDFKGLKLRASSAVGNQFYEKLGATPVSVTGGEIYTSVDRKVIDGFSTAWTYVLQNKMNEVTKYVLWNPPTGRGCPGVVMSKTVWEKLPADIQKVIDQCINDYKAEYIKFYQDIDNAATERLSKSGLEVYSLSDDEIAKLKVIANEVGEKWVADQEAKGQPAKEVYAAAKSYLKIS